MQRKLLRIAGFYGMLLAVFGAVLTGCVEEPTIEPVQRMTTSVRIINCIVDQPSGVDIWVDSLKVASAVGYKGVLDYQDIPAGTRFVRVTAPGSDTSEAILRGEAFFRSLTQTSFVLYGVTMITDPEAKNRAGWTITQEHLVYSDETSKLPADSGKIKLINCIVSHVATTKVGAIALLDTLYENGVPAKDGNDLIVERRIENIASPPVEPTDPPNLSAYIKYPLGDYGFEVRAGVRFLPNNNTAATDIRMGVERKFYTFVVTGILNDQGSWDILRLVDP